MPWQDIAQKICAMAAHCPENECHCLANVCHGCPIAEKMCAIHTKAQWGLGKNKHFVRNEVSRGPVRCQFQSKGQQMRTTRSTPRGQSRHMPRPTAHTTCSVHMPRPTATPRGSSEADVNAKTKPFLTRFRFQNTHPC